VTVTVDRDLVEVIVSLALIGACAGFAVHSAGPRAGERTHRRREKRLGRRERVHVRAATEPAAVPATPVAQEVSRATADPGRPRIFTGEPASTEVPPPASRRALRLVAGMTVLAAAGAVGLLALVRAMVAMFDRIGG
jgi:hypothetical protein